jgi:hypothetical protein
MLRGACHCGAVRFEVSRAPDELTSCNCSYCTKRGTLCAYYYPEEFTLISDEGQSIYLWNDRIVKHHFCSVCGCSTFGDSPVWDAAREEIDFSRRKLIVNARLFEDFDLSTVPVRHFDGRNQI